MYFFLIVVSINFFLPLTLLLFRLQFFYHVILPSFFHNHMQMLSKCYRTNSCISIFYANGASTIVHLLKSVANLLFNFTFICILHRKPVLFLLKSRLIIVFVLQRLFHVIIVSSYLVNYIPTIEQVFHFRYLGCDITCNMDYNVDHNLAKFLYVAHTICGTIRRVLS